MTLELGIDLQHGYGRVRLFVSSLAAGGVLRVDRFHPSGEVFTVRGMNMVPMIGSTFLGWDYEQPIRRQITYVASVFESTDLDTPLDVTDPVSVFWDTDDAWLKDPLEPFRNVLVHVEDAGDEDFGTRLGVFDVVDRPAPVTIGTVRSSATGELKLLTETTGERDGLHQITAGGHALLFQQDPNSGIGNLYLALAGVKAARLSRYKGEQGRRWTLPYVEVDVPVGDNPSGFTTYADMAAQYATYQDIVDQGVGSYQELVESIGRTAPLPTLTWRGA